MLYPEIRRRKKNEQRYEEAIHNTASPLQAEILSKRCISEHVSINELLNPTLEELPAGLLKDADKAATRIVKALTRGETIGLLCDFDVDGISSAALLDKCLVDLFGFDGTRVKTFISDRMNDGYGFTEQLFERIKSLNPVPTLLITADQGSKDELNIGRYQDYMRSQGMIGDVIVTDHHHIESKDEPKNAVAFVNPQQETCKFPDDSICGCVVAMLVMSRVRKKLIDKQILRDAPKMGSVVPFGACATIADCSDLSSPINRAFVKNGFKIMNASRLSTWEVFRKHYLNEYQPITSQTVGFGLAPDINACSRTGEDGFAAVKFFRADDEKEAMRYLNMLSGYNGKRKKIETTLFLTADYAAALLEKQGYSAIVVYLPNGHHGIHGIVSSGLTAKYGKPVIVFSPAEHTERDMVLSEIDELSCDVFKNLKENIRILVNDEQMLWIKKTANSYVPSFKLVDIATQNVIKVLDMKDAVLLSRKNIFQGIKRGVYEFDSNVGTVVFDLSKHRAPRLYIKEVSVITGSARSIDGIDIAEILEQINEEYPEQFIKCGGHKAAAGMKISISQFENLKEVFNRKVKAVAEQKGLRLVPFVESDGVFPENREFDFSVIDEIRALEPFGNGFPYPCFEFKGTLDKFELKNSTLSLKINFRKYQYDGVWYKFDSSPFREQLEQGKEYVFVASPTDNYWNNKRSLQLQVQAVKEVTN